MSSKKFAGSFEFIDGKLFLFTPGNDGRFDGAKDSFLYGRQSRSSQIRDGHKNWVQLREMLLDGRYKQRTSQDYKRTAFDIEVPSAK